MTPFLDESAKTTCVYSIGPTGCYVVRRNRIRWGISISKVCMVMNKHDGYDTMRGEACQYVMSILW